MLTIINCLKMTFRLYRASASCAKCLLNLDKCKVLAFLHFPSNVSRPYFLHSTRTHIRNIVSKPHQTLGYLRHTLKLAPSHVKLIAYQTLLQRKLEDASSIWSSAAKLPCWWAWIGAEQGITFCFFLLLLSNQCLGAQGKGRHPVTNSLSGDLLSNALS